MENTSFLHLVLIRYNVPIEYSCDGVAKEKRADEMWLKNRQPIFENITYSSLKNQSVADFETIVFFDRDSPDWLKEVNDSLDISPMYVSSIDEAMKELDEYVKMRRKRDGFSHVILTRIDNDDAFHCNAIEKIQSCFKGQEIAVLNLSGILCFMKAPEEVINYYRYPRGPFESIITEIGEEFHAKIFDQSHGKLGKQYGVTQLGPFPYALQYVHGQNIANDVRGIAVRTINLKDYGINYQITRSYLPRLYESLARIVRKRINKRVEKLKGVFA